MIEAKQPSVYIDRYFQMGNTERTIIERSSQKRKLEAKYQLFMSIFEGGKVLSFKQVCERVYAQGDVPGFEEEDTVASYLSYLLTLGHILEVRKGHYKKDTITTKSQLFYDTHI